MPGLPAAIVVIQGNAHIAIYTTESQLLPTAINTTHRSSTVIYYLIKAALPIAILQPSANYL